jgi:predicted dienelactone hydrolase
MKRRFPAAVLTAMVVVAPATARLRAQTNHIDIVAPMAPELAPYGRYDIGVRTLEVTDRNRPDIVNTTQGSDPVRYDRRLTLEVWYPARLDSQRNSGGEYRVITRDPAVTATLIGKAVRDADPAVTDAPFPVVIVSHGYPGNRFLMSHLTENLASKGFVVVAIDHRDSTYDDQKTFASTLYNRPFDQLFVLNEIARQSSVTDSSSFLAGLADASRVGLIGYSMGGYGVVNVVGGGYSAANVALPTAPPNRMLAERGTAALTSGGGGDVRVKAAIAIAPWGMQTGFWDAEGLRGIKTPLLFVAGSADEVAGYEKGTRAIYQGAVNADRYLLTFVNANHNAAAPIPAPAETYTYSETLKSFPFMHYADAVWDSTRMNNILQHFATAFFDWHLKGDSTRRAYFELTADDKGLVNWKGFKPRTAVGLTLDHAAPADQNGDRR